MATDHPFKSRLLQAKQKRKEAAHDAQILENRLALLEAEERKARRKIDQTRARASELLQLRVENERKMEEKRRLTVNAERMKSEVIKKKLDSQEYSHKSKMVQIEKQTVIKRCEVQALKIEKQVWRKEIEENKKKSLKEAEMKKAEILLHKKKLKMKKEKEKRDFERRIKDREDQRLREEEAETMKMQDYVKQMEAREMELIQGLRNTQLKQQEAYQELENALGGSIAASSISIR